MKTQLPGRVKQAMNNAAHTPWGSMTLYHIWWLLVSVLALPFSLVYLVLSFVVESLMLMTGFRSGAGLVSRAQRGAVPLKARGSLVVAVTGCDTGFGHDAAIALASCGFTVFAGCLRPDYFKFAEEEKEGGGGCGDEKAEAEAEAARQRVVVCALDVTSQDSVDAYAARVTGHVEGTAVGDEAGALHALVNNAGVGSGGCVDWLDLADFRRDMEVNCFGMIRVTKALLPLLKRAGARSSSSSSSMAAPRVVNVTSMAGLMPVPFMAPYCGSKHAAEAVSACLRTELIPWGVKVVTMNPSFHQTPLVSNVSVRHRPFHSRIIFWCIRSFTRSHSLAHQSDPPRASLI